MGEIFRKCIQTASFYICRNNTFKVCSFRHHFPQGMSENKGLPGSLRTGGFGLTLQSVCSSRKKCCQRCVLQPVPPSASLMSFLTPLAVYWVWHPYLPLNGSQCILAICGIDHTAPTSPSGFPTSMCLCVLHPLPGLGATSPCSRLHPVPSLDPSSPAKAAGSLLWWNKKELVVPQWVSSLPGDLACY